MLNSFLVSWRNVTKNKKRFFFTLVAIVTGVIIMTAMLIVKQTTSQTLDDYERMYAGSADYFIQSNDYTFAESDLDWLYGRDEVIKGNAALLKQGFVELSGVNPAQTSVRLTGVSSFDNGLLELPVKEGDVTKEGLIITENAAKLWQKEIGDTVTFVDMGSIEVTAIVFEGSMLSSPQTLEQANTRHSRVMVPLKVLQNWTGMQGEISNYRFETNNDLSHKEMFGTYQSELSSTPLYIQPVVIDDKQMNDVEGLYWTFDIIAILSIFISGFIVFNMIYSSIIERRKEFAIMKSLGYTNGDIQRLVSQEIGILALLGTTVALPVGILFGSILQKMLMSAIATQNITYELELVFPLILSAIIGITFPFLATSIPVYQAGRTSVMEAIVEKNKPKRKNKTVNAARIIAGIVCTGIGMIDNPVAFLFIYIGLVLLYPIFMRGIQLTIRPLFKFIFKFPGKQADQSVRQFQNRNVNTSAMLAIGVSLALFMSATLESLPVGMDKEIRSTFGGDIHVAKESPWLSKEVEFIQDIEGTENVYLFSDIPNITWRTTNGEAREFSIMSFSGHAEKTELFRIIEETTGQTDLPHIYLGERAKSEWGGKVGDTITLNTPSGKSDFFVKGSVQTSHYTGYVAFVEESILESGLNWPHSFHVGMTTNDEESTSLVTSRLWEEYGGVISKVSSASQIVDQSSQALVGMKELMQGLLILVIALSAIGISNTLFMNTLERILEIGMMRAIGFTKLQVKLMIIAEGLIIGVTGIIVGTVYGIFVIYLNSQSTLAKDMLIFTVPWSSLFLSIIGGLLFTLIAAWLPSITASRVSIKEAIAYE